MSSAPTFRGSPSDLLLLHALIGADLPPDLDNEDWETLIRLARRVKLLGRLALRFRRQGGLDRLPEHVVNQLRSGEVLADRHRNRTNWELDRVLWALAGMQVPVVVLKGVAYALAGLPNSEGRLYVDLDIMVPKRFLTAVETRLRAKGWQNHEISAYDQNYYRAWMHEIPALVHPERGVEVDIHHTIAPQTSALRPMVGPFFDAAVPVQGSGVKVLSPPDMVLQCAVNLFHNNELADDLRDLLDLHDLVSCFSRQDDGFWAVLLEQAETLNLQRPLFYGLRYSEMIFGTGVPAGLAGRLTHRPGSLTLWMMDRLVPACLFPVHPDHPSKARALARFLMYLRSHWLKMPPGLLLRHLGYKGLVALFPHIAKVPDEAKYPQR